MFWCRRKKANHMLKISTQLPKHNCILLWPFGACKDQANIWQIKLFGRNSYFFYEIHWTLLMLVRIPVWLKSAGWCFFTDSEGKCGRGGYLSASHITCSLGWEGVAIKWTFTWQHNCQEQKALNFQHWGAIAPVTFILIWRTIQPHWLSGL